MAKIEGLDRVIAKLRALAAAKEKESDCSVAIGYTAGYALYVHENREIWPPGMRLAGMDRPLTSKGGSQGQYWDPQGRAQPKFLEEPFRTNRRKYAAIVANAAKRGLPLHQALMLAALEVQRDSQLLVPVDLGNLKASAFTRLEQPARG